MLTKTISLVILFCLLIIYFTPSNIFDGKYFDANASTPMCFPAMIAYMKNAKIGNPSAYYATKAKLAIKQCEEVICHSLNICKQDYSIIFNSGASESNNFIFRSLVHNSKPHYVLGEIEHKTSLECVKHLAKHGYISYTLVKPDKKGVITTEAILKAIQSDTVLVSVMHANNETGILNPIKKISEALSVIPNAPYFHSDVVQTFGKLKIPMKFIDAISVSAHKFHGALGCGLLVISKRMTAKLDSCEQISGSQFDSLRGGTENIPGIMAMTAAINYVWYNRESKNEKLLYLRNSILFRLEKYFDIQYFSQYNTNALINKPTIVVITDCKNSIPNTLLLSFLNLSKEAEFCNVRFRKQLFEKGYIVSISSACNTSSSAPSHVLQAMNLEKKIRSGVIRISLCDYHTRFDVYRLCQAIINTYTKNKIV